MLFAILFGIAPAFAGNYFRCESNNYQINYCYAGFGGVSLIRQLSSSPCVLGQTWGYDSYNGNVWVQNGCRADFESYGGGGGGRYETSVTCQSFNGRTNYCQAGGRIANVYVERQLSASACDYGRTWGYDQFNIWVSRGCRAVFRAQLY